MFGKNKNTKNTLSAYDYAGQSALAYNTPTQYTCEVCGCYVNPKRMQKVTIYDRSGIDWTGFKYYCIIDALPYDRVEIICKHETHYYQNNLNLVAGSNIWTEVKENGKPLPKAKVN